MTPTDAQPLAGQTALITGGARRLGAAIARALHAQGANVVIHHLKSTQDAAALITAFNAARTGSAIAVQADLLDTARLPELAAAALRGFGRLDMLCLLYTSPSPRD